MMEVFSKIRSSIDTYTSDLKRSRFMAIHLNSLEAKTSLLIRYYKDILCAPVWIPNLCILDKIRRYRCSADCSN